MLTVVACKAGDLRIVGGFLKGRVDMCYGGIWRPLCDDYWTFYDYTVACRQLGFSDQGMFSSSLILLKKIH